MFIMAHLTVQFCISSHAHEHPLTEISTSITILIYEHYQTLKRALQYPYGYLHVRPKFRGKKSSRLKRKIPEITWVQRKDLHQSLQP